MSKLIVNSDGLSKADEKAIVEAYSTFINSVDNMLHSRSDFPASLPEPAAQKLLQAARDRTMWELDIRSKFGGKTVEIHLRGPGVEMVRIVNVKAGFMEHDFFELSGRLQGKSFANHAAKASLAVADHYKIKKIELHANLDVGGYAWIRKGAIPTAKGVIPHAGGALGFLDLASEDPKYDELWKGLNTKLRALPDEGARRAFLLTDEFKQYKPLFLGTNWFGEFDISDPTVRAAMIGEAVSTRTGAAVLTANEQILDRYIRHQTFLLRYAGGLRDEMLPMLAATEKDLYDTIVQWVAKAGDNRQLIGASGRKWQREFRNAVEAVRLPAWDPITAEVIKQTQGLAVSEAATGAAIIEGSVPVVIGMQLPPAAQLISIVNSQPFEGRTLKQWLERTAQSDIESIVSAAKIAIVQGQTPTQAARSIIGTQAAKFADGTARKAFRDLESVILTITNGVQNEAKQALYAANADIIKFEQYVNTLDVRTTIECIGAGQANEHGKGPGVYPRGKGPIPPLHFRCRSLRVPYLIPENLGNRPFDPTTEKELLQQYSEQANIDPVKTRGDLPFGQKTKFDEFARLEKRKLIGQVPATTSYGEFLGRQSKDFQDQVLGPTRAEMFRKGDVTLDKFVARDGDVLTLDELSRKGLEVPT